MVLGLMPSKTSRVPPSQCTRTPCSFGSDRAKPKMNPTVVGTQITSVRVNMPPERWLILTQQSDASANALTVIAGSLKTHLQPLVLTRRFIQEKPDRAVVV